jgi:hypothetical protein
MPIPLRNRRFQALPDDRTPTPSGAGVDEKCPIRAKVRVIQSFQPGTVSVRVILPVSAHEADDTASP